MHLGLCEDHSCRGDRRHANKGRILAKQKRTDFAISKFTKSIVCDIFHGEKKPQGVRPVNLKKNIQGYYQGKNIRLKKQTIKNINRHRNGECITLASMTITQSMVLRRSEA